MAGSDAPYSARQVEKLAGLTKAFIKTLADAGVITPQDGDRYTLQDLVVLRTAKGLKEARVPPRKIILALKAVSGTLPGSAHLASVRLRARGRSVEAADAEGRRDVLSGQMLLPFDPEAPAASVETRPAQVNAPIRDAAYWTHQAVRLEASDAAAAENAYLRAIAMDPCHSAAYVNLGAMLCEAKRCAEAVALYDSALDHCGDTPLVHFNRATALEDSGKPALAVDAYRRALELDPLLADAHYNLGVLMERLGDSQASLRHLSSYRRLRSEENV